jgi:MFS family permease
VIDRSRGLLHLLWPDWIGPNLRIILIARLTMSAARGIAGVVTALYLAAEGFSAVELGVLFFVVTATSAVMATLIGLLADRFGRKPFLIVIPLLAALAGVVYAVFREPVVLFAFAAVGTFGRGAGAGGGSVGPYQPAESAFVAEVVTGPTRAAAFGRLAFFSALGALAGGLLAGLARTHPHLSMAEATAAYRPAFLAAALLAAAAGLIALRLEEEPARKAPERGRPRIRWPRRSWPALWRFWVTNGVNGVAIGMFGPFMSYWLYVRYGATPGEIGILFALVNLGSLVSTLSAASIARRLGTVPAIVTVRAVTGVMLVPMVLAPSLWIAGTLYFLRMVVQRVGLPLRQSFTQDLADPEERASLAALSNLPAQGTMAGSQVLAGYLFDEVSLAAPFELAAFFQVANAVLYGALFGPWRPRGKDADLPGPEEPVGVLSPPDTEV